MTALQRSETAQKYSVFARMSPEHKVEVVHALESAGLVTVMVGDGANDAAAIRAASVGVGVVSTGSDPARMAADVMLLDGEIGALVYAIDEGEQRSGRKRGHDMGFHRCALCFHRGKLCLHRGKFFTLLRRHVGGSEGDEGDERDELEHFCRISCASL